MIFPASQSKSGVLPVRLMFVVSAIGLLAALLAAGCATAPPVVAASEQVAITVHPWERTVRLVGKAPPAERYLFVGKVRAVTRDDELVDAAAEVDQQLRTQARALGADVVKIDVVQPGNRKHIISVAGRAYRSIDGDGGGGGGDGGGYGSGAGDRRGRGL